MNPHEVTPFEPDQLPQHKPHVKRTRRCPRCKYPFSTGPRALCPLCHNCVDCGAYNGFIEDDKCDVCGNHNPNWPIKHPIIHIDHQVQ